MDNIIEFGKPQVVAEAEPTEDYKPNNDREFVFTLVDGGQVTARGFITVTPVFIVVSKEIDEENSEIVSVVPITQLKFMATNG